MNSWEQRDELRNVSAEGSSSESRQLESFVLVIVSVYE